MGVGGYDGMGSYRLMGTEFLFGVIKIFWRKRTVMITQHYECT